MKAVAESQLPASAPSWRGPVLGQRRQRQARLLSDHRGGPQRPHNRFRRIAMATQKLSRSGSVRVPSLSCWASRLADNSVPVFLLPPSRPVPPAATGRLGTGPPPRIPTHAHLARPVT